ncbi:hypothetical protein ACET3X_003134 [Alternaria dauci]|uniref:Tail specific protease domain-containing protein n=1 Tax=Alternaria dauci TaxID=48095 RepID=A0ABR3US18_9PLEO
MRSFIALSALLAAATAQSITATDASQSFDIVPTSTPRPSSIDDIELDPTTTESVSGPIETNQACGDIAELVANDFSEFPVVDAALAYACLKSLPFDSTDASSTVDEIKKMVEFQSTLTYLKDPPRGWPNEAVDIVAGLDDIKSNVESGQYSNEFDFETDIASLMVKAHDGHLGWNGMAYAGAFRWRRSSAFTLVSASRDGSEIPQIWALEDFNGTVGYEPSPVTQIDGRDVVQFLMDEANLNSYHDPDTRFNAMFFSQAAENYGYFTSPRFYPGATTNVTYENGTTDTYSNGAIVLQPETWSYISDPDSFYDTYVRATTSLTRVKKRDPTQPPLHLENPRDYEFRGTFTQQHGSVPLLYPDPVVAHSADLVPLAGFFINTGAGEIGVLAATTFNTEDVAGAQEFQAVIQEYISQAQSRGVEKHIIDLRANNGGKVLSGYDMYLQFFPSQEPQTQSRYRGHRASEVYGESISSFEEIGLMNAELFTSPFSNDAYLSSTGEDFPDWKSMYPPERFNNDQFTALLKYNLSNPLTTSNERTAVGITMTGYNSRSNFTTDPFRAEDIILLTDGVCASTCSVFTELMVQQSGVRSIAIGGRPSLGPMVAVGGTKGTLVLPSLYMEAMSEYVTSEFASSRSEANDWAEFLPSTPPIAVIDASVNFQDNIRAGFESAGVPTQFLNDTASCRIWYEPGDYFNVTRLWEKTANVAFGNNGGLDEGACVAGSVTSSDQQQGRGESNPESTGDGNAQGSGDEEDAASGLRVGWVHLLVSIGAVALSFCLL